MEVTIAGQGSQLSKATWISRRANLEKKKRLAYKHSTRV